MTALTATQATARILSAERSMSRLVAIGRDLGVSPLDYAPLMVEHEFEVWQAQEALRELGAANDSGSAAA